MKHICKQCTKEYNRKPSIKGYFCSNRCQIEYQYDEKITEWLSGRISGWTGKTRQLCKYVKTYLHKSRGTACEECKWDKCHPVDGRILTEIDHVNGDAEDCRPENLKILCPNCHSMTETFRARNKNSKRKR